MKNRNTIKVIYRDRFFLAAHKPSGIPTYETSKRAESSQQVIGCKEALEEQLNQRLFPVHRIDSDTEGLVLFALTPQAASGLIRCFKEHQIKKTYVAWCVGETPASGSIKHPLRKNKSKETEPARTDFIRIKTKHIQGKAFSQVRAFPFTGRFHQIRRHFSDAGHSLVGDPLYGDSKSWEPFFSQNEPPRLLLFAESVEFQHPFTRKPMVIKAKI